MWKVLSPIKIPANGHIDMKMLANGDTEIPANGDNDMKVLATGDLL